MCSHILSAHAGASCCVSKEKCFCMCGWDRQSDLARWNPFPNMSANAIESRIFIFPSSPSFIVTCPFLGSLHSEHRRPTGPAIRQNRQLPHVGHPAALLCLQMLVSAPLWGTQRQFLIGRTTSSSLMCSPCSSTLVKFLVTCGPFKCASIARWSLLASEVASSSCMLICMILLLLLLLSLLFSKAADLSQERDLAPPRKDQK